MIKIELKINKFSLNEKYDYASCVIRGRNLLPNININLPALVNYCKKLEVSEESGNIFQEEISSINQVFCKLIDNCNLEKKYNNIKEKNIIFYLYQFMNKALFYIILNPNFCITKTRLENYFNFFKNFIKIKNLVLTYLNPKFDIEQIFLESYKELFNFPNEFKKSIEKCQNFLSEILFIIGKANEENGVKSEILNKYTEDMINLLEIFVINIDILHKINQKYSIIDYKQFYNQDISKNLNLNREFEIYLHNERVKKRQLIEEKNEKIDITEDESSETFNNVIEFTLLNYIWLFDAGAKNKIINLYNEHKQNNELINNISNDPQIRLLQLLGGPLNPTEIFFLLKIRRNHLIEDTLNEVSKPYVKLQNPLKVQFIGEEAVDEGGVSKEFFMLLVRKIFDVSYGMFTYNKKTRYFWFNLNSFELKIKYELIGIILGLAIFNKIILDVKFPMVIYKKLLGKEIGLEDMKECDIELYNNLKFLIETKDKNIKENIDTNFTVCIDKFGEKVIIPLKENGENIMIDYDNKNEYVNLYIDWYFNKSIQEFYESFEKGFYRVFDKNLSKILSPEELELIICGTQKLDFNELKSAACYEGGYDKNSKSIKYFWEILLKFNEKEKKKFLFFVTGCDRAPIDGLKALSIVISKDKNIDKLPLAHTCFNNLILPDYQSKELMKKNILIAINYSEGFGLL